MWQAALDQLRNGFGGKLSPLAGWAFSAGLLAVAAIAALLLYAVVLLLVRRAMGGRNPFLRTVLGATKGPIRLGLVLIALAIALPATPLDAGTTDILARLLGLATICLLGWTALTVLHIAADLYLMRFRLDADDNLLARKHVTQVRVLQRILEVVIVLVTLGFALMTFDAVRQFGVTLFASAGVAGIVAGLAARPVLSNFLAGVQLAVAQPIRIDDAVTVENEYGNIEEITFSYVVVRLWDLRRLVVPLSYFIEKPFQNLTRTGGELSARFFSTSITPRRSISSATRLIEIVSPVQIMEWQGRQPAGLRLQGNRPSNCASLVSANNGSATWDLRCELREKLIEFLQREYPSALPRRRYETVASAEINPGTRNRRPGC